MSWTVIAETLETTWVVLTWQLFEWWEYDTASNVLQFWDWTSFFSAFIWIFRWLFLWFWPLIKILLIILWCLIVLYVIIVLFIKWFTRVEEKRIKSDITPEHKEFKQIWKEIILSNMYNHWSIYDEELEKEIKEKEIEEKDTILESNIHDSENKKVVL